MRRTACTIVLLATAAPTTGQGATAREGEALLDALIATQRDMAQMTADYVQYRSSKLLTKPLESRGRLAFRREPGCVVFRVTSPRESVVRLDTENYEVWHPDRNRLERFVLPSAEMPRLLFDALAPTKARMREGFSVASCAPVEGAPTRRLLTLLPTDATTQRVASKITLLLDTTGPRLCGFGYQNPQGEDVRLELGEIELAPKADPALFALDVPKGAKIVVHEIPAPEPAAGSGGKENAKRDSASKKTDGRGGG